MGNATGSYGCGAPHDRGGNETKNATRLRAAATIQTAPPTATATRRCPCSAGPHAAATEIANPIPNTNAVGKVRGTTSSGPVAGRQSMKVMAAASPKTTTMPVTMEVTATTRRASPWLVEPDPARAAAPGAIARSGSTTTHATFP